MTTQIKIISGIVLFSENWPQLPMLVFAHQSTSPPAWAIGHWPLAGGLLFAKETVASWPETHQFDEFLLTEEKVRSCIPHCEVPIT